MSTENPYQSPQSRGNLPDNRRLRRIAKVVTAVGLTIFALGGVLMVVSIVMMFASFGQIAQSSGDMLRAEDVARGIANASIPWTFGVPIAIAGTVVVIPSSILWFMTRKANSCLATEIQN
jgi:hypothetical protein